MVLGDGGLAMKQSKFADAQIAFVLLRAEEGTAIVEVCRKKYGGLKASEMRRLKRFEEEKGKLRKLMADLCLDLAMLQDVLARKL